MSSPNRQEIRDHYRRVSRVYSELGSIESAPTLAVRDLAGWYIKRDATDEDAIENGYEMEGRVVELDNDLDEIVNSIDRVLYALTSYKRPDSVREWIPCTSTPDGTEWDGDKPTPEYADIKAISVWGDMDLADEIKYERNNFSERTKAKIEWILKRYAEEFSKLYGTQEAVYGLDSVGGAYLFGAPEATRPIARYYSDDGDARTRVFQEFRDRSNSRLEHIESQINDEIHGAEDLVQPDWVNNCNRQYKAPLSLHKDEDAVVTPLDVKTPCYDLTLFSDVDDALIDRTVEWAQQFTSVRHEDCVQSLVKSLWPEYADGETDWQDILDQWLEEQREAEQEVNDRADRSDVEGLIDDRDGVADVEGLDVTPHLSDIYTAIDHLDAEKVAEDTIVDSWTDRVSGKRDTSGKGKRAFIPTWNTGSCSGTANYIDTDQGTWVDTGSSDYGTVIEMALIGKGCWSRGDIAEGEAWFEGVEHLRDFGYDIPVWTPDATSKSADGETYDKMPLWSIRRAAVALGVVPQEAFIERETEDGSTYLGFPGRETYQNALEAIEDAGLEHGRESEDEKEAREQIEAIISRLSRLSADEDPDDELDDKDWARVYEAVGEMSEDDLSLLDELSNLTDTPRFSFDRHRKLYQHQRDNGDVIQEDNELKLIKGTKKRTETLVNFGINVDSFLSLEAGDYMADVEILPKEEPDASFEKQVAPRVFNRPQRFKDEILAERFSTTIEADEMPDEDVLDHIRMYIHRQDAPKLSGTKQMGLKDGQVVTPNGVITPDGWDVDSDIVYVERDVGAERKFTLSPNTNEAVDEDEVSDIVELFSNTRSPEELLPVLCWFYAAPFKPKISRSTGSFNLLSVEGDSGTGKTGTIGTLWQMFGMCENGAEPFSCNDTTFSMITTLASSRGVPMWFDEYKPSDMGEYQSKKLHDLIKKAATGGTEQRGNADKTTEEYHLRAPIVLSGEEGVVGSAEKRRTISTSFSHSPTQEGTEECRLFKQLVGDAHVEDGVVKFDADAGKDLRMHGLAYYQYVAGLSDEEFGDHWRQAKVITEEKIHDWDIADELDDLEKQGLQTVIFGYRVFRDFAKSVGADVGKLPGNSELNAALRRVADVDGQGRETHLDRYVQLLTRVTLDGDLEDGTHYHVVDEGGPDEELRVNVSRAHDKITKYAREHDINEDILAKASDYRNRFKEAHERDETYVTAYSQNTHPINRAVGVDMRMAEDGLEDFDRDVFTHTKPDVDALSLSKIESGETVDITVQCKQTMEGENAKNWLSQEGWLLDSSGNARFELQEDDPDYYLEQNQTYRISDALVRQDSDGFNYIDIVPAVTDIEEIELGDGHTDEDGHDWVAEAGGDTDIDDSPAGDEMSKGSAAADGGSERNNARSGEGSRPVEGVLGNVKQFVATEYTSDDIVTVAEIAGELGDDPEKVADACDHIAETHRLLNKTDNGYRVVKWQM